MKPSGLRDIDPLRNHKYPCASHMGVYIGFHGAINLVDPLVSLYNNGTRCRDGVNVLWCRSHIVWLVFEGSIPKCACFPLENFFVTFKK